MIVVTGATGRTGRAATEALLVKGEKVRVVGRDGKKLAPLVELGAEAFVGNVEDIDSMTGAFNSASAVYLVLPEDISQQDLRAHQERVSDSYAAAITNAHVRFVVNLSSIGAQHAKNTGPIRHPLRSNHSSPRSSPRCISRQSECGVHVKLAGGHGPHGPIIFSIGIKRIAKILQPVIPVLN